MIKSRSWSPKNRNSKKFSCAIPYKSSKQLFLSFYREPKPAQLQKRFQNKEKVKNKFIELDENRVTYERVIKSNHRKMDQTFSKLRQTHKELETNNRLKKKVLSTVSNQNLFKFPSVISSDTYFLKHQVYEKLQDLSQFNLQAQVKNIFCVDTIFPISRVGPCLIFSNQKLYIYGGVYRKLQTPKILRQQASSKAIQLFHSYNKEEEKWQFQNTESQVPENGKNPSFHTCESFGKNYIILIGGIVKQKSQKITAYNPYISLYNTLQKNFLNIKWNVSIRSHASIVYGNILIIHGGYGENNKIVKTLHIINIQSLVNNNPLIVSIDSGEHIAQHKMVSTYEIDINQRALLTNNDGIITFGGQNSHGLLDNNLRIIRFYPHNVSELKNIKLKKWQILKVHCQKPCKRINHSMDIIKSKAQIVVIGGKDENENLLNDIWVMDIINMHWINAKIIKNIGIQGGLASHSTTVQGSKIYIYGGIRNKTERIDFWTIETDIMNSKWKESKMKKKTYKPNFSSKYLVPTQKIIKQYG